MADLTPFGKELRKLRIDRGLKLFDVSKLIGKSTAMLSALETGAKPIPDGFVREVRLALDLSADETALLNRAKERTAKVVRVDHLSPDERELVAAFARRAPELDAAVVERIKKTILKSRDDEEPFRRKRGVRVQARKRSDIERIASEFRVSVQCSDIARFPIIEIIEFLLPRWIEGFSFEIGTKDELGHDEGRAIPAEQKLILREDVYASACNGHGRPRFTAAHELGHYLLHSKVTFARACSEDDPIYIDAEWQADAFAGFLMMPRHLCDSYVEVHEAAKVFGTSHTAMEYTLRRYEKDRDKGPVF